MTNNIWFTSDTHFHHKNIVSGTTEWEQGNRLQRTRLFDTLEAHDEALVKGINYHVKKEDTLYHLGDWSFGGFEQIEKFRSQLNVDNIILIYGNHDHHLENNRQNIRRLFKECTYYKEITIDNQRIVLSHFAHRVWNKSHHGAFHLYGHSHGTLPDQGRSMDVGVDVAYSKYTEYRPFSWKEIYSILSKRSAEIVDHHNEYTN